MSETQFRLPFVSADLPGIGGRLRGQLEDFQVEEIPAYEPCGEGDHVYAWIEKRAMTTPNLLKELATALGIRDSDIGVAGMKDKFAVTRQWVSLPPPASPEQVQAIEIEGVTILATKRHGNKLRTGHLRGNRFILRVRDFEGEADEAAARARAILERMSRVPGAPNWYGAQRFGREGKNARIGKEIVTKSTPAGVKSPRGRQRRLYISSYQSELFNAYLAARMQEDLFGSLLPGEVLQKRDSGGMFVSEDPAEEQARFDRGELSLTGPMFGHKMKCPTAQSPAAEREDRLLQQEELTLESFKHLGKLAAGTRRPLSVILEGSEARAVDDCVEIQFTLPSGSYATAIMREIIKGSEDFPN